MRSASAPSAKGAGGFVDRMRGSSGGETEPWSRALSSAWMRVAQLAPAPGPLPARRASVPWLADRGVTAGPTSATIGCGNGSPSAANAFETSGASSSNPRTCVARGRLIPSRQASSTRSTLARLQYFCHSQARAIGLRSCLEERDSGSSDHSQRGAIEVVTPGPRLPAPQQLWRSGGTSSRQSAGAPPPSAPSTGSSPGRSTRRSG